MSIYTTSEIAAIIGVWALLGTGCFFGIRAAMRRKAGKNPEKPRTEGSHHE